MSDEKQLEDVLKESFEYFRKTFIAFIFATIIAGVGSIFIITAPPLFFGLFVMGVKVMRGEEVAFTYVFKGFDYVITAWVLFILYFLAVLVGLVFLIIPGLALMVLLQYSIPIAIIEGKGAIESLKRSYRIGLDNLQFSIILAIILFVINALGSAVALAAVITYPYSIICYCVATKKLTA
jgi:hypothetical protein